MARDQDTGIDWSLTTFEGARREQQRRWAEHPLAGILEAPEQMEALSKLANDGVVPAGLPSGK